MARQKGLEPLATILLLQRENNLSAKAASFVKGEVKDVEDALKGARDIIAEQVNEDERARNAVRNQFGRQAEITAKLVKGKEEEAAKYRDYFDFSEPLKRCTSHRLLAIRRAESEGLLKVSINPDDEACIERLERQFVRGNNECSRQVGEATTDAYKRLLKPSIETEFAAQSKEKADDEAIRVFTENRCSPSTPDSVPDVRWFVSTRKAICCIMRISIRILRSTRPARLLRNFAR